MRKGNLVESADPQTGLGADDRAGAAVLLATAERLLSGKVDYYPTTLLWTVQEEVGLYGAKFVNVAKLGKPKLAFNFDGGSPTKLTVRRNGWLSHDDRGAWHRQPRGGAPEEGVTRDCHRVAGDRRPGGKRMAWIDRKARRHRHQQRRGN